MGLQNKRERMAVKTKEIMKAAHGGIFSPPVSKRVFFYLYLEKNCWSEIYWNITDGKESQYGKLQFSGSKSHSCTHRC